MAVGVLMAGEKSPFFKGAIWIGLLVMLPTAWMMISVLNAEPESFALAPRWLVFSAALLFFNTGITVGLMDTGFNEYRQTRWLAYLQGAVLLSMPLIFVMLFNWVAFGPGRREFSMSVSIPFIAFNFERANEIIGRVAFAIPALIMDFFLLLVVYQLVAERFGLPVDFLETDEAEQDDDKKERE
ncbi:MAG: hypothetical protein Kow002_21250 [Anaerolineales bacterium]